MAFSTQNLVARFGARYGAPGAIRVFRAPGRVNLIGEHTDYNSGFVLPIALEMASHIAAAPNNEAMLRVASQNNGESAEWKISEIPNLRPQRDWTDYVVGVAIELHRMGYELLPMNLLIDSTVPVGAGLSSSAALEISSALALLSGRPIEKLELARLGRRAENHFVGMPCGLMDQYISVFGEENKAVLIDCLTQDHKMVSLPGGIEILAVNTMVKHELGQSAYRERVRECGDAVEEAKLRFPSVSSLRDMTSSEIDAIEPSMPDNVYKRARHVTSENERVQEFVAAAGRCDLAAMGKLFVASHRSLQHDYEVSCDELDFLVDTAISIPAVYGARMTGGGFGGCTVNLLKPGSNGQFTSRMTAAYRQEFGLDPQVYSCHPSAGAGEIT